MNQDPTYNPLELLRRWVRGETPHGEERQLEQLAEDDPFLAEALEGYRRHPEGKHAERIGLLKARLPGKGGKSRRLLFYLPRLAAATVALALMVGGFWYINREGPGLSAFAIEKEQATEDTQAAQAAEDRTAEPQTAPTAPDAEQPPAPAELQKKEAPADQPAPRSGPAEKMAASKQRRETIAFADTASDELPPIARAEIMPAPEGTRERPPAAEIAEYDLQEEEITVTEEEEDSVEDITAAKARTAKPQAGFAQPSPAPRPRKISGYVEDEKGEPLIGANVLIEGTQQGAVTDFDGRFTLELPESPDNKLIFNYVGYESKTIDPKGKDSLAVVLSQGEALLESVTVTGYSTSREGPAPVVRPAEGFGNLRQYIHENLQYPEDALKNGIEGRVKLTFRIQPDGTPDGFRVNKSLGYGCDEEAKRLLREGPKWEGAGQEAKYTIRFKLNK